MDNDLTIYFQNAKDELNCAKNLANNSFYRGSINHCYYTCLWLVRGLLTEKEVFTKSHNGAAMLFYEHYVKSGEVPREMAAIVKKLLDERQEAQYDVRSNFTEEEATEIIALAETFFDFITNEYSSQETKSSRSNGQ
jgi:uncharacterized protein (UPF0332 family)